MLEIHRMQLKANLMVEFGFEVTTEPYITKRVVINSVEYSVLYDMEDNVFEILNLNHIKVIISGDYSFKEIAAELGKLADPNGPNPEYVGLSILRD